MDTKRLICKKSYQAYNKTHEGPVPSPHGRHIKVSGQNIKAIISVTK